MFKFLFMTNKFCFCENIKIYRNNLLFQKYNQIFIHS